ncbi:MAG: hypothetical protein JO198_10985 [Candidatus Dormibacteraeota bacterium]|nr:hypothetical protein [Candidatus Dormibacteraeota bacterium]
MADWVTISALATAGGTLVLAVATFASVRSANRAARVAERSLLVGLRPLLMPSRLEDGAQKVGFADEHFVMVPGGGGSAEVTDNAVYLVMSVRNAGNGIAVLHGWRMHTDYTPGKGEASALSDFRVLTRDIYVPAGDVGFWQGALRDPAAPEFLEAAAAIRERRRFAVELLYGDHEGGQRTVSLFGMQPRGDGGWFVSVARHWNIDRSDPR